VTVLEPSSVAAEAYRGLRTKLLHASFAAVPPKVLVLTSHGGREGKSSTCANLSVVLAQGGKNVLTIDCDFRKPDLHKYFGLRNTWGIVDVLAGEHCLREVWEEPVKGLKVVSVGSVPHNPPEILESRRFSEFLGGVREEFDWVLLDGSPVGVVSDAVILATQGDGVLFVLDARHTRKVAAQQSMNSLKSVGANVVGVVVNNVQTAEYYPYYHR